MSTGKFSEGILFRRALIWYDTFSLGNLSLLAYVDRDCFSETLFEETGRED